MPHMLVKRLKSVEQLTLSRNSTLMVSFYVLKNLCFTTDHHPIGSLRQYRTAAPET